MSLRKKSNTPNPTISNPYSQKCMIEVDEIMIALSSFFHHVEATKSSSSCSNIGFLLKESIMLMQVSTTCVNFFMNDCIVEMKS